MVHVWDQYQVVRGSLLVGVFITFRFGKAKRRTKCITSKALPLVPAALKGLDIRKLSDGVCPNLQRAIGQQSLCCLSLILVLLVAGKQFFWGKQWVLGPFRLQMRYRLSFSSGEVIDKAVVCRTVAGALLYHDSSEMEECRASTVSDGRNGSFLMKDSIAVHERNFCRLMPSGVA